jgi:hypothetical protein
LKVFKHRGIVAGWLVLFSSGWAHGWMAIKFHEPPERWDVAIAQLAPAPLENPGKPLWVNQKALTFWSYPTEVEFIAYPEQPSHNTWVAQALEKYRIRLLSPLDLPYTLEPLAARQNNLSTKSL